MHNMVLAAAMHATLLVTNQFGEVIYRKPFYSMQVCLNYRQSIALQGQAPAYGGQWISKDRYAPRAVCVPR
jgi:hypothetical protein